MSKLYKNYIFLKSQILSKDEFKLHREFLVFNFFFKNQNSLY